MKKLTLTALLLLTLALSLSAQTYYNLKYTWEEIDSLLTSVRDSIPGQIASKLDANVSHIMLSNNCGVPTLINLSVHNSPLDTEHGYVFAVDSTSVLRLAAHTTDGYSTDSYSVTIGSSEPDPDYTLTVAGPAVASSWDVAGADFAEWFRKAAAAVLPVGTPVIFNANGRVRAAAPGDIPFGVISAGAGFVGNTGRPASPVRLTAFGDTITVLNRYVQVERPTAWPEPPGFRSVLIPLDRYLERHPEADPATLTVISKLEPVPNKQFGKPYTPHSKDPDYVLVGLVGQIPVRKGAPTSPNWFFIRELDEAADLWLVK